MRFSVKKFFKMPAEHVIKDDDDFEEDTLFDQAGLLTNKIKKSPDIHNVHSTMRITPMKTFALCLAFFGLGISLSILEPTLLDLQYLAQVDFHQIFYVVSGRSVGSIIGLILGMILFDRYNRQFLLFLSMLAMTVLLGVMPWCNNLAAYVMIMVVLGALMQLLYAGGNVLCLDLWGRQSGPFLQAIHFSLSVGLFIAPLLSTTITAGKAGLSVSEMPDKVTLNNSLLLSLPASALYSIHFRLPSLQSRHRRSLSPLDQNDSYLTLPLSKLEMSNVSTTVIVPLNFTFGNDNNGTLGDQRVEFNATMLPLNASEVNVTLANSTVVQNGNSTMTTLPLTPTPNVTGITPHKPKPKPNATYAQHLPDTDPWSRNKQADAKPVVTPPPSSVATTAPADQMTAMPNVTSANNRTESSLVGMNNGTMVENYTDVQDNVSDINSSRFNGTSDDKKANGTADDKKLLNVGTPSSTLTKNDDINGNSTLPVVNNEDGNESLLENTTKGGVKLSTFEQPQNEAVTDESEKTLESTASFKEPAPTASLTTDSFNGESDKMDAENNPANVNDTVLSDTGKAQLPPTLNDEVPSRTETNVLMMITTAASTTEKESQFSDNISAKDEIVPDQTTVDSTDPPTTVADSKSSPSTVAVETTSVVDDSSSPILKVDESKKPAATSNCSSYKTANGSDDKVEHHKKPNTFNNQTEENQMLLSELLSQITAMGMTKVHIVYAVMAVIVFLTSLVFLSFLCQNPRELRSKQEEGVKPGIPESKFTSIMVGLTFVLMIFYTMAHLIFSQLYLSLVLQESVHLLHSRGSLLISVFWGIYTFSRATSICCTNGFKPVTMLLLDFVCCIVSSVTLSIIGSRIESVLWCSVAVMSIGLSSIFPYCLLWLEDYIHISNRNMCIILMGSAAVDLILSLTFGHAISLSSATVMYLVLVSCIFALLIFGIMWRLATWRGDKYGFSKADMQYHLASQIDEEEDSIEFPSGNSSLYLLNGGTHFPLSSWDRKNGNSYIPLKHNNTVKWK